MWQQRQFRPKNDQRTLVPDSADRRLLLNVVQAMVLHFQNARVQGIHGHPF